MKNKQVKILQVTAVIFQLIALVIVVAMTMMQDVVKGITTSVPELKEIFSLPIASLLKTIVLLITYVIACVIICTTKVQNTKIKATIMIAIASVCQIVLHNSNFIINMIVSKMGVYDLASYTALESMIGSVTSLFIWIAFALFCFSCGRYYGSEMNLDK